MEPWDGPAAVVFTDGRIAGAMLDRNGLRPGRWIQDTEGYVVLASETGVLTVAPEHVQRKGRLQPGKMFLLDLEEGKIVDDEQAKLRVARRRPTASGTATRWSTSTTYPIASRGRRGSSRCGPSSSPSATRRRT